MKHSALIILGTARVGRNTEHATNYVYERFVNAGFTAEIIDIKNYPLTHTQRGAQTPELKAVGEKITQADVLVVVTPEYNHGYPGELKLFIDTFFEEYKGKPFAFVGVGGVMGGGRAIEQLRQVVVELNAFSVRGAVYFPAVWSLFEEGKLKDHSAYDKRMEEFIQDIRTHLK